MYERKLNMQHERKINNRNLSILRTLTLMMILFFSLSYVQNIAASEKSDEINTSLQQPPDNQSNADLAPLKILQKISQAQKDGKYAFLLFYETGNSDCNIMAQRLDEYAQNIEEKVEIIKIDRNNPENSTIVASMRVQTAPVPLTLLKDPKGQVVNVFKTVVSEDEIRYAIPSPKKTEAMTSLQNGKSVILSFMSNTMPAGKKIEQSCEEAKTKLEGKAEHITIDVTDPKEKGFLKELKINPESPEPITIVINTQRQIAGTYAGDVKVEDIVLAATKKAAGGCCPGGSGKSCGPGKQ
jgi:thiol-disulfide isomerase/thioredoxin